MASAELTNQYLEATSSGAEFTLAPSLPLRKITGYNDQMQPIWGESIGIYHPTQDFLFMDPTDQLIHHAIAIGSTTVKKLVEKTGLSEGVVQDTLTDFKAFDVILSPGQELPIPTATSDQDSAYIRLTTGCNLECSGCAVGTDRQEKGHVNTLDASYVSGMLGNLARSTVERNKSKLLVKWAGGEPTLKKPWQLIQDVQPTIAQLTSEYPQLELSQALLTNGTHLTPEVVNFLKQQGITTGISLWGLGDTHNQLRSVKNPEKNGYEQVVKGIQRVHEAGVPNNIIHVLSPDNAHEFADFLTTFWDTQSPAFIGKNWQWEGKMKPIPLHISFYRGQTAEQIKTLQEGGYESMVHGLRQGFKRLVEMMQNGVSLPPLDNIDYMRFNKVTRAVCGSGDYYLAVGKGVVTSCHQKLFGQKGNIPAESFNPFDFARDQYEGEHDKLAGRNIIFEGQGKAIDPGKLILSLHGGTGCPLMSQSEHNGELGYAASTATKLNEQILEELLSLEAMRRKALMKG